MAKRVLITWLGHTDLRAMSPSLTKIQQEKLKPLVRNDLRVPEGKMGPIKTLLSQEAFDEIHLLSNSPAYPNWVNKAYSKWLGKGVIHVVKINNPTDYEEVYNVADTSLKNIIGLGQNSNIELSLLLSPGTPTMAAIWILLGGTKYPAKFWQTHNSEALITKIPFDLTVDVIPEILRDSDSTFHHLASQCPKEIEGFHQIIGNSKVIRLAVGRARKAAVRDVSVLLLGESGTGKEIFAQAIHAASSRKDKPFIVVNCAAIPKELLESELFGHTKGSFTGATTDRDGAFVRADEGILFLDEIGECDFALQAKLLRVLQPPTNEVPCIREIWPVGADEPKRCNVRVIAATNRNLVQELENNQFRQDLFYRLAAITIKLPPLRERKVDIPLLAESILSRINKEFETQEPGYKHKTFSASANIFMKKHLWPGNVRELANVILQAAVMSEKLRLDRPDIEAAIAESPIALNIKGFFEQPLGEGFELEEFLNSIRIKYLVRAMSEANGVKAQAARLLGMPNYQTLANQLKKYGIEGKVTKE